MFAAALAVVPAALATHPSGPYVIRRANLDSDRARERAVGWLDVDSGHTSSRSWVTIDDRCGGRWKQHRVSAVWDGTLELQVLEADVRTGWHEVFYVLRAGRTRGEAAVVQLNRRRPCPAPRFLFHYVAPKDLVSFLVQCDDFIPELRGREVLVQERTRTSKRVRYYWYDPRAERYRLFEPTRA